MAGLGRRAAPLVAGALVAAGLTVAPAYADDPAIDGPLTSGDSLFPNQGNGGYDVSHYDVDISWTPAMPLNQSTIDATTTIQATTTGDPLSSFGLDLEGLTVTSVEVNGDGRGFTRINGTDGAEPPRQAQAGRHAGRPGPRALYCRGRLPRHARARTRHGRLGEGWIPTADGATFLNQPIGSMTGFPNNDTPKDKATYTFSVDVPDDAGGRLQRRAHVEHLRRWSTHLGLGRARPDGQRAGADLDRPVRRAHLGRSTCPADGRSRVDVRRLGPLATAEARSTRSAAQLSSVLTGAGGAFGPYPGHSTGIVVDNSTGVRLRARDAGPAVLPRQPVAGTLVHELVHQWYGDAVAPADWNGLWVNEGMATWAPTNLSGNTETTYFNIWNSTSGQPAVDDAALGDDLPSQPLRLAVLHPRRDDLRGPRAAIGNPAFVQLIKQWQTDFAGRPEVDRPHRTGRATLGPRPDAFFQDWIYDNNKPAWPGKLSLVLDVTPPPGQVLPGSRSPTRSRRPTPARCRSPGARSPSTFPTSSTTQRSAPCPPVSRRTARH